jgi:hypothetical protein
MSYKAYHFRQQDFAILCQFDLSSSVHEHFDRPFWTEVCAQDILQSLRGRDVDLVPLASSIRGTLYLKSLATTDLLCFGVQKREHLVILGPS